jgi:arylsulfatase A-like enzyme
MKNLLIITVGSLLITGCTFTSVEKTETRPNIVLIMVDDMGYSDVGCYGGEVETPNIDALAGNGVRFSQFYNAGRCCPTRASIMTGLYPHRAGMGHMATRDYGFKGYKGELRPEAVTVAENLNLTGYDTWMVGKWHLSINFDPKGPKHNWPLQRGFDRFYGTLIAAGSLWNPVTLTEGNEDISPVPVEEDYYYTEAMTDKAIGWVEQQPKGEPFFLYVAQAAPHWPLHARQEVIEKYKARYAAGWDALREARILRLKAEGLLPKDSQLSTRDPHVPAWSDTEHSEWQVSRMAAYAAMIEQVDTAVGKLVAAIEARGELDNTLILFCSDNGGSSLEHPNGLIGSTGAPWTTMRYVPVYTRDGRAVVSGDVPGLEPGPEDTYGGYGYGWANLANAPFRLFKKFAHEGGIATPLVVHWPAGIAQKGTIVHDMAHVMDIMPTCLAAAGAEHPAKFKEQDTLRLDGTNLLPVLAGESGLAGREIGFEHAGNRAFRMGDWKLVAESGKEWELFNLGSDRSETRNLADARPEQLQRMVARYDEWARENWVEDWSVVSASLSGKQAGTVVLPDEKNPLRRSQEEIDESVKAINKARVSRGLPLMKDLSAAE